MFNEHILKIRRTIQQHNANVEQEWINIHEFASARLYEVYFDSNYNRFWTLEDPQYIARCRLYSMIGGNEVSITIEEISNAFGQACDLTDLKTTTEKEFLSIFHLILCGKYQVVTPVPPTYAF